MQRARENGFRPAAQFRGMVWIDGRKRKGIWVVLMLVGLRRERVRLNNVWMGGTARTTMFVGRAHIRIGMVMMIVVVVVYRMIIVNGGEGGFLGGIENILVADEDSFGGWGHA